MTQDDSTVADPRDAIFDVDHIQKNLGKHTGNAAVVLLLMSILRTAQQILAVTITARLIGPAEYGIFALAMPGVVIAIALSNFGLPQAIIQRKHMTHKLASTLFWLNVTFGVVAMLAVALLSWWAGDFFREPRVVPVFQVISLAVLFAAMSGQYMAIMRRTLRVRESEVVSLCSEFLALGLAILCALAGLSYWALVIQHIASPLATLLILRWITGWRPSPPRDMQFGAAREALRFGGYVAGYSITGQLTNYAGTLVTGRWFNDVSVGLFSRAHNLATLPRMRVMTPLSSAFVPALSRLQDDPPAFVRMYARATSRSCLVMMPIAVMLAAGAEPMTEVLLGKQWLAVTPMVFWMSLMTLIAPVNLPLHFALLACGRSGRLFATMVIRLVVVVLSMILSGQYGVITMTAVYMLTELLVSLPLMIGATLGATPVTFRAVLRSGIAEMAYAALVAALLISLKPYWSGHPALVELVLLGLLTGVFYGLRVAIDPNLRGDVMKTLLGRFRRGRR